MVENTIDLLPKYYDKNNSTDPWQIFGPTIEYIAIHSALTENVSIA